MDKFEKEKLLKDISNTIDQTRENTEDLKSMAQERYKQAKKKMYEMRGNLDNYVSENPEKSVLMSVGLGVILGATIAMMMKNRCKHY